MSDTSSEPAKSAFLSDKRVWAGGGAVALIAVAAGLYFGGVFGPSSRDICTASLKQAKDFGVIAPDAALASNDAKSTDVKGRKSCTATVGSDNFTLLVDMKKQDAENKPCKDLKKQNSCVALYSVVRTDGMTTYQVREIPPGETDEALAAAAPKTPAPQQGQDASAPAPEAQSNGMDTETAVDNSGSAGAQPQGGQPAPAQPQQ